MLLLGIFQTFINLRLKMALHWVKESKVFENIFSKILCQDLNLMYKEVCQVSPSFCNAKGVIQEKLRGEGQIRPPDGRGLNYLALPQNWIPCQLCIGCCQIEVWQYFKIGKRVSFFFISGSKALFNSYVHIFVVEMVTMMGTTSEKYSFW